jgi:hypothetical protein
MKTVEMVIDTVFDISSINSLNNILKVFDKYSLIPDKIGPSERNIKPFNVEYAHQLWISSGDNKSYICSYIFGRKKIPNISYTLRWNKGENARSNHICLLFNGTDSFKDSKLLIDLFRDIISIVSAFYGYISDHNYSYRQNVPGLTIQRLPGIHFCNYFGKEYLDLLGEKLLKFNWNNVEKLGNGTIFYLTKSIYSEELDNPEFEICVKSKIGISYFGDSELYKRNIDLKQQFLSPQIDMSQITKINT